MARSFLSTLRDCALAWAVALAADAQNNNSGDQLEFTSGPLTIEATMMRAQQPRITQGNLRIAADDMLATGFEFDEAGEFRLTGNVRFDDGTSSMKNSEADFS